MFKDSSALDRQRTAAAFRTAHQRYAHNEENWYRGTVDSVDARLAACTSLLHRARSVCARVSINDSGPYLRVARRLEADQQALESLRHDLLTGAASREDVTGPPGWRTASSRLAWPGQPPPMSDEEFYNSPEGQSGPTGYPKTSPPESTGTTMDPRMKEIHQPDYDPEARFDQRTQQTHDYINQAHPDLAGGGAGMDPEDIENQDHLQSPNPLEDVHRNVQQRIKDDIAADHTRSQALEYGDHSSYGERDKNPTFPGDTREPYRGRHRAQLAGTDRRWVELESAKFVAANADCLDDSHELATRASHYAALKTSTFTQRHSAAISEAFVAQVTHLGAQAYRPTVKTAAVYEDFDPQAMFL